MKKILAAFTLTAAVVLVNAACEPPARHIEQGVSPQSGALAVDHDKLLIAAEDHGQLLVVDRLTKKLEARVDVGDTPGHVIVRSDGTAAVSVRYGNSVAIVDVNKGRVIKQIPVGVEPFGLVELKDGKLAVVLAGEQAVAVVDVNAGAVESKVQLSDRDPRAIALLADGTLYVSHMATGKFSHVNLKTGHASLVDVTTINPFGPQITAEHLRSLTVDPNTGTVLVAHTEANTQTVRAPIGDPGEPDPTGGNGQNCGYSGCQQDLPAATPAITEVDPTTDTVIVPQSQGAQNQLAGGGGATDAAPIACNAEGCGGFVASANPPSVLNPHEARLNGTKVQNPAAVALFDGGRGQIIVNLGSKNALILNRTLKGTADDVIATVSLGNGAQSIAISDDGATAYVWNQFDLSVSEIQLPKIDAQVEGESKFVPDQNGKPVAAPELGVVPELAAKTVALPIEDKLSPEASIGRKLFHDATDTRISQQAAVSCATCHPDGRNDGRTWQFVFGPRNTPQLGGSILDTAPFHWPGDVQTVADLNQMTVLSFMGGTGLDAGSFQYIAAYIDQLRPAPSTAHLRTLTAAEQHGKEIFESDATQCTTCHAGRHGTDNLGHDIKSASQAGQFNFSGVDITTFQTPVLHGLARSAPYFHDGRFATLDDMVNAEVATNVMGHGSQLSSDDRADLVAYLKTL